MDYIKWDFRKMLCNGIYLTYVGMLQGGVGETESSRAIYEIARAGENGTS